MQLAQWTHSYAQQVQDVLVPSPSAGQAGAGRGGKEAEATEEAMMHALAGSVVEVEGKRVSMGRLLVELRRQAAKLTDNLGEKARVRVAALPPARAPPCSLPRAASRPRNASNKSRAG